MHVGMQVMFVALVIKHLQEVRYCNNVVQGICWIPSTKLGITMVQEEGQIQEKKNTLIHAIWNAMHMRQLCVQVFQRIVMALNLDRPRLTTTVRGKPALQILFAYLTSISVQGFGNKLTSISVQGFNILFLHTSCQLYRAMNSLSIQKTILQDFNRIFKRTQHSIC